MIVNILTVLFFVAGFVLLFRLIKQGRRHRGPYVDKTGRTANLTLRSIGPAEYDVIEDGNSVGRIMLAGDPHAEVWLWNCSLPGSGFSSGTAASLEDAPRRPLLPSLFGVARETLPPTQRRGRGLSPEVQAEVERRMNIAPAKFERTMGPRSLEGGRMYSFGPVGPPSDPGPCYASTFAAGQPENAKLSDA